MDLKEHTERFRTTLWPIPEYFISEKDKLILKLVEEVEGIKAQLQKYKDWIGEPNE